MDMPTSAATGLTLKDLFDAGLHFGHQTKRWNPKMKPYIFDKRNGIHIIDLTQTVTLIDEAAEFLRKTILDGKKILFIATKKQAQEIVKQAAEDCGQYYMTERWLGGTLTNSQTIRGSVKRMRQIQALARANNGELSKHKQEASMLRRELAKLEKNLTGIADMDERPGAVFTRKEHNAIAEARKLHIPIVAIVDTNCDPDEVDYVIPGNDDSVRGIEMLVNGIVNVVKSANDEYSRVAAEQKAKRDAERAAREEQEKAERAARKEKAAAEKRAAAEAKGGEALKTVRSRGSKSGVSSDVKQIARKAKEEAEAKAKAELAAARKEKVEAAQAAVVAAESATAEAPAAEAPAAEAPKAE